MTLEQNDFMSNVLMPINENFIDVFDTFMDENQKTKIRANNVRQYIEGIVDLLLREKIIATLKPNEVYEGVNWGRKINIIKDKYDEDIGKSIQDIFRIGGDGSHFNGQVNDDDLGSIISKAVHIVEDIFVLYFLEPEHQFGKENIYTIFSMLPLHNRIYILEKVSLKYTNQELVDRLSLAYIKSGKVEKAYSLLMKSYEEGVVSSAFYEHHMIKLRLLNEKLSDVHKLNENYSDRPNRVLGLLVEDRYVVGLPSSKDVFDTARAVQIYKSWFDDDKDNYPEFINLFLYLMQTDNRAYEL